MPVSRRQFGVLASVAAAATALAACTEGRRSTASGPGVHGGSVVPPTSGGSSASSSSAAAPPAVPAVVLALSPGNAAAISPAIPVTVTAGNGTIDSVTLRASDGSTIPGTMSADGTAWTATGKLGYRRSYTLSASAKNSAGVKLDRSTKFSTASPGNLTMPYLNTRGGATLVSGVKYGVGMVIRVHFDEEITDRAAAEKALIVTTNPYIEGSWFWMDSTNVLWRPKTFYTPGTQVRIDANVYGVKVGPGLYGQANQSASFVIGDKHLSISDDKTKQVSVYFNNKLQRSMPTSMGRGGYATGIHGESISFFTPSGTYTVLDQNNPVLMDSSSYGLPVHGPAGYKEYIAWATRISTDGIYLHQLNSTVWAQGNTDTSHGCLNLNGDNATWFYRHAQIGDVVQIKNTGGAPLAQWQNGDWSVPWAKWVAGSALHA
jgi:lipoprotein-anchoring transpeptidase ErfK/SrfK